MATFKRAVAVASEDAAVTNSPAFSFFSSLPVGTLAEGLKKQPVVLPGIKSFLF
jgi:hypothetical protein